MISTSRPFTFTTRRIHCPVSLFHFRPYISQTVSFSGPCVWLIYKYSYGQNLSRELTALTLIHASDITKKKLLSHKYYTSACNYYALLIGAFISLNHGQQETCNCVVSVAGLSGNWTRESRGFVRDNYDY